jgi:glucokinase
MKTKKKPNARVSRINNPGESEMPMLVVADVGGSHITVAGALLSGQIAWREEIRHDFAPDPDANLAHLFQALDGALARMPGEDSPLLVVGAPSSVDFEKGVINDAYALGWVNLPLKSILQKHYRLTALVDNDVNLATLGEARFGAGKGMDNLVCMLIGTNIGGGLIIGGELYRGPHGMAGEIGWMVPEVSLLEGHHREEEGCLESYAGGRAIARQARLLLSQKPRQESLVLKAVAGDIDAIRAEHVFDAARQGDEVAQEVLDRAIDYLSVSMVNIINLLDPELIVVGGGVSRSGEFLINSIRQRIAGWALRSPRVVLSVLGEDAVLYGAVALAQEYLGDKPPSSKERRKR